MFSLNVSFTPANAIYSFLYKTEIDAKLAQDNAIAAWREDREIEISDDFGQWANFDPKIVNAILFENMELTKNAHIERGLWQARAQADANNIAQADPKLRTSAMMRGGNGLNFGHPGAMPRA